MLIGEVSYPYPDTATTRSARNAQGIEYQITKNPVPITAADVLISNKKDSADQISYHTTTDSAGIWQCFVKPDFYWIYAIYFDLLQRKIIVDSVYYNAIATQRIQIVPKILCE